MRTIVVAKIKWRYRGYQIRVFRSLIAMGKFIANEDIEAFEVLNKRG